MKVSSAEIITNAAQLIREQDYSGALELLQSIQLSALVGTEFVQYCIEYTHASIYTGNYDISHIDAALGLVSATDAPSLFARAKMFKGLALDKSGAFREAAQHYLESSAAYRNVRDEEYTAVTINLLAWAHYRLGDYPAAQTNYSRALEIIHRLRIKRDDQELLRKERDIAHNLANLNIQFGRFNKAIEGYLAYPLSRDELNTMTAINYHINIAQAFALSHHTEKAREALAKCEPNLQERKREQGLYWNGFGIISFNNRDFEDALSCFEKAATQIRSGDSDLLAGLFRWQAESQLAMSQYEEANISAQKAFDHAFRSREQIEIGCCHRIFGCIAAHQARQDVARNHFTEAMTILERIDSQYELARTRQFVAYFAVFPAEQCRDLLDQANSYFDGEDIPRLSDKHTDEILVEIAILQSNPTQRKKIVKILEESDSA